MRACCAPVWQGAQGGVTQEERPNRNGSVLRNPPSNDGMGDARHQQADGEAEEHADGNVAEVVGCHHDAAQGDEDGPDEDAEAVDAVAARAVVQAEAQEGADGEAKGVTGVAGEEAEETGAVEGPVEATLQHFCRIVRPETVHAFFYVI